MNNGNLYESVKNKICDLMFEGVYPEGERIPAERVLAEELDVSRVTVRKSLELLERENLVVREVGSGTRVCFHNYGSASSMDMIVLIAPAKNPFFSDFIGRFQTFAEQSGALVLYVEKPQRETIENCLYRLYKKGLQNAVIWLEDLPVDVEKLKRLRALGLNMVFFDTDRGIPYADCVTLDNALAVRSLYEALRKEHFEKTGYIGWDRTDIYSVAKRETEFLRLAEEKEVLLRLPWGERAESEARILDFLKKNQNELPRAILCGDRENGIAASNALKRLEIKGIKIAVIDESAEAKKRNLITYVQDLEGSVKQIFSCLLEQNHKGTGWKARIHMLPGILQDNQSI